MVADTLMNWEADTVDVPSASVPELIAVLRGGESITIKSLATAGSYHYIGASQAVSTTRNYLMESGETITLKHDASFGRNSVIKIWALASTAGDDICYMKLFDTNPATDGSGA